VALLVLAIVAPLGLLAVVSVQRAWRRQLANVQSQNVATVRAISVAVDQQIERTASALEVLGELHAFDSQAFAAFEDLASRVLPYQPNWSAILLADAQGTVIAGVPDTADGDGSLKGVHWARAALDTKRTAVSHLLEVPGRAERFVIVGIPVVRDGKARFALGARLNVKAFSETLRRQQTPPSGAVAIVGSDGRIIARSGQNDFVGTPATQAFIDAIQRSSEGTFRGISLEGVPTYAAFSRSAATGLAVGLGLPADEVDAPIRRILWWLGAAWALVLAVGAGIGLFLGNIIVRAMSSASSAAMALARGETVSPPASWITEIDELAASLRRASATLEERNRERDEASRLKDEFLMTISHELRTPLTAICGWARMLSSGQIRESQRPNAIASIERNGAALQQLVDDLLDVSRIVAGKLRLDVRPVALKELVAGAADAIRPAAEAKSIQVSTHVANDVPPVNGDPARLQQVVWNLLSNAVKFTPSGGRIDIACRRAGDNVELVFSDTGAGIDPQFVPFVFERFRQGASGANRPHGGLGIGLSIVRDLVELHGGTVTAENNRSAPGATFRVLIPAVPSVTYSDGAAWSPSTSSPASPTEPTSAAH
jgi:signal transduction histidine kinase